MAEPRYSARRVSRRILACIVSIFFSVLLAVVSARNAGAASNDKEVEALIDSVMQSDYLNAEFKAALEQLDFGKQACEGSACSAKIRAKLYIAIGTIYSAMKKPADAKKAFATALKEDPTARLMSDFISPDVEKAFNEVRSSGSSGGSKETKKDASERKPKKVYSGHGRPPRGWKSAEAYFYFKEATKSEKSRDWLDCVDYAQSSLAAENRATTRFLAASCEERAGLWLEAIGDYQIVADNAGKTGLFDTARTSKARADELGSKIPKIIIRKPAKIEGLVVKMNDTEIAPDKLGGEIWVNPGQRTITAHGKRNGVELEFEQTVDVAEFETTTVEIKLGPKGAKGDEAMMRCMLAAQTREDFAKCLKKDSASSSLNFHVASEVSGYHDSNATDVVSPAFVFNVDSPTAGWGVSATFLVDVVTTASTDIIATASPRWRETRYVPSISGHKKFGGFDVSLKGNLSREPDYLATSVGTGVSFDLANKSITPSINYEFSYDISGRSGTPFSVFGREITRHGFDISSSFVINKATVFAASFTAVLENGDTSKPYRYIPMFSVADAAKVPAGLTIEGVHKNRLPIEPLEQLPTNRQRWAVAGLIAHRFASSTFRAEERLYIDSWGLKASTTEGQFLIDMNDRMRVWPQARFHAQTAASFWQLAYAARLNPNGTGYTVPALRTGDRELGPLVGVTLGGGIRYALGEKKNWAISFTGDVVYTRFLQHLYLLDRMGYFGATTLEVDFE